MLIDSMQSDAERAQVGVAEKITGLVADRAKPCVAKAIDYTLLVVLLLLQFMRCTPATSQQIIDGVSNGTFNTTSTATSIYSCDLTGNTSLLFSSTTASSLFIITAVAIALIIGIFYSVFVWVHAHKLEEVTIHPWTDKLYKCTSKIIILDTFIEIPISFYLAPIMALLVWTIFTCCVIGLFFLSSYYNTSVPDDANAQSVFSTSVFLVILSLFKLTGEVSQYWVLFKASTSKESRDKFDENGVGMLGFLNKEDKKEDT